jgi:hypothetical protein
VARKKTTKADASTSSLQQRGRAGADAAPDQAVDGKPAKKKPAKKTTAKKRKAKKSPKKATAKASAEAAEKSSGAAWEEPEEPGTAAEGTAAEGTAAEGTAAEEKAPEKEPPAKKASRRKSPRKKRARKKADKKAGTKAGESREPEGPPVVGPEPVEPPKRPVGPEIEPTAPPEDGAANADAEPIEPVEDLDADLTDDDLSSPDAVSRLIAETLAVARRAEGAPEPEDGPIDLDEQPPEVGPAPASLPSPETGPDAAVPQRSEADAAAPPASERSPVPPPAPEADTEEAELPAPASVDLGPVSTPEFRSRLLAEALAHAEHQDARYRVPFSDARRVNRVKGMIASLVFLVALVVAVVPPSWVRPEPPAGLSPTARARAIRVALLLQAQQIEAYRVRSQELPKALSQLPIQLPGVRYARSGNRAFQLIAYEPDGNPIVYDSSNPTAPFRALAGVWAVEDGAR